VRRYLSVLGQVALAAGTGVAAALCVITLVLGLLAAAGLVDVHVVLR